MTQDALDLLGTTGPQRAGLRDRVLLLRSLENFQGLDEEGLTLLAEQARHRRYRKGDVITAAGAPPESMHILVEGHVTVTRKHSPLVMTNSGGIGVLSVVAGLPHREAVANADTRTLEVPAAAFNLAFEESFSLLRNGLRMMAHTIVTSRGSLPADPKDPPQVDLGTHFARPKTLAERLIDIRAGMFAKMNLDAIVDIARGMTEVRVPAGHVFWSVGDPATDGLLVDYGRVRCTAADGAHMDVGSGFTLGMLDVMAQQPNSYEARADTDVIAYRISGEHFLVTLEMHVQVGLELLRDLARRMIGND